jgi:hypothetical protein
MKKSNGFTKGTEEAFNITCPICKKKLVPTRVECDDGSGWTYGYTCDCNKKLRDEYFKIVEV